MIYLQDNHIQYTHSLCQQCGACYSICPKRAILMEDKANGLKHISINDDLCIKCQRCVKVCPAHRDMIMENEYETSLKDKQYFFAWSADDKVRHESSSGGATKTIIIESLKSGFVDGVYSLRKLENYPSAVGEFYIKENIPAYDDMPNSVYHSVMACTEIKKVQKVHRLMIVGTSCQLYALERALRGKYDELVKVCIFCKQQKTLDSTRWLAKVLGTSSKNKNALTTAYRGLGWPGFVCINSKSVAYERAAGLPFGRRLWTVPGCNACGDPFGMEVGADISVMDPWGIRQMNDLGETLVTAHTEVGLQLIKQTSNIGWEAKTYEQVEPSLDIPDIWRKRMCVPFFRGEKVSPIVKKAAEAEVRQRQQLEKILELLPRLPFIAYRIINKILPTKRDNIIKYGNQSNH